MNQILSYFYINHCLTEDIIHIHESNINWLDFTTDFINHITPNILIKYINKLDFTNIRVMLLNKIPSDKLHLLSYLCDLYTDNFMEINKLSPLTKNKRDKIFWYNMYELNMLNECSN